MRIKASLAAAMAVAAIAAPAAPAGAQKARSVMDRTVALLGEARNITAPFTLVADGQTVAGTLLMAGDKFRLTLPKITVWYDGRSQWSLDSSTKEVYLSEPMPDELAQVNPLVIITALDRTAAIQLLRESAAAYTLRLTPDAAMQMAFADAVVDIDKSTSLPTRIALTLPDKKSITLNVGAVGRGANHPASTFVYNKADHPGYSLIDLR